VLRRVFTEQRRFIVPLAIALALTAGFYALVVFPLSARVAQAERTLSTAAEQRRAAAHQFAAARDLSTRRARAETELREFYRNVLPVDMSAAHRTAYLAIAQLARSSNVRIVRRSTSAGPVKGSSLDELKTVVMVDGEYGDIRTFIYKLETAPEFVVIDDVTIEPNRGQAAGLTATLALSTYFLGGPNGD
jgi:hypothetical protein